MKFFKPEDFIGSGRQNLGLDSAQAELIANVANAKLEREGKVVYEIRKDTWHTPNAGTTFPTANKALLINIEPIEKCTHPAEKVGKVGDQEIYFECECGARVKPKEFEVCE